MKKRILKAGAYVALTILLALTTSQIPATGQIVKEYQSQDVNIGVAKEHSKGRGLVGTWLVQVTIRNCQTGAPIASFPSLLTYARGGTLMSTTSSLSPALNYPGQGVWHYVGGQSYAASFMFFRFNPDGSFAGTQKITQDIEHDRDADVLNITATFEVFNATGNVVGTGCVTATGTRFE